MATPWVTLEMEARPLSDYRKVGRPGCSVRALIASVAFSEVAGKASAHPEKVSTKVSRYLGGGGDGVVESTSQS